MKKLFLALLVTFSVLVVSGCKSTPPVEEENTAPVISGVQAQVDIDLGDSWNALDGITADDTEDGDLTSLVEVTSIPALTFTDGVTTPAETGDYYITYTVIDSEGELVESYTTLTVNAVVGEKVEFIDFLFTEGEADLNGFEVGFNETATGTSVAEKGALTINVTDNGDADWHVKLFKTGIMIEKGNTYEFKIRMKASETIKLHYIINNAEAGWAPLGGQWNMEVGTDYADYSIEFLASTDSANVEFLVQMGGDNFDGFTNPGTFSVMVDSIAITSTPTMIEEELYSDDYSTIDKGVFEVGIGETAVGTNVIEDGYLKINLTANGDSDWHAKVFKSGIQIEQGATYTFTVNMKASETVKMHYIINNAAAGWAPFTGQWNMEVGTDFANYTLEFIAGENSDNTEFLLQFGGDSFDGFTNPEAWNLTIDSINIVKGTAATVETVVVSDDFEDNLTDGWSERGVESHSATISNVNSKLQFQIDSYPVDNNPWEMDLYLATDYDLVSGNMYKVVFDYTTTNDQFYELCFEDMNMDWQIRAGFKNGTFSGEGTLEYVFIASMDITDLYIKLSLGKGADGVTSNTFTLDNVMFYEITGATESETEVTEFTPDSETISWGTYNNNDEGAYGVVYAEDGKLIYEIESFGATDWFNKIYFENVDLTGGGLYTLEFTIKADKELEALAGLNVTGQWDPRIWEAITIGTTETTYSFTMDAKLLFDMNFEILFQFGFANNEAPATIEFTNVTIYRQE